MKKLFLLTLLLVLTACGNSNTEIPAASQSPINDFVEGLVTEPSNESSKEPSAEELQERYLNFMHDHFAEIGLLQYIEGGKLTVKDLQRRVSDMDSSLYQYTYELEGRLTSEYHQLHENDQYDLLERIDIGFYEFYWGHQFDVAAIYLLNNSDTYTITYDSIFKNGEYFWEQLENPFADIWEELEPLDEGIPFEPIHEDFLVYEFMIEQYNLLTNNGANYRAEIHDEQIAQLAAEAFGITPEHAIETFTNMEVWYSE